MRDHASHESTSTSPTTAILSTLRMGRRHRTTTINPANLTTTLNATTTTEGNLTTINPLAPGGYDYEASFIKWTFICSIVLGIALGLATFMYIKKATNWDYRRKMKRMIQQRKLEFAERRKVRRVKCKWQSPEEFLSAIRIRHEEFEIQRLTRRYDPTQPNCHKDVYLEYENLRRRPPAGTYHYTSLKAFEMSGKNFIKDCLPFDHNRIKLPLDPSVPCSDYINGSFVEGYSQPDYYLAIQGPFESSIVDFWRVVWLHKVRCIVMLCEPFEFAARQCFRYWPDKSMSYDDIDVKCESVHRTLDFTYRKFSVTHAASHQVLEVMHFQYKYWPQFGQPDVYTFLHYVYKIREMNTEFRPVIVHSKTGSDRTGLYIAIDYCLESICSDNIVNVHECVRKLRRCRAGLVSSIEQYEFVYNAVRVFLLCGITEVPTKYLKPFVQLMGSPMNGRQTTGFDQQYEVLDALRRDLTQNDSATGIMSENRWVSRDATCLPPDEYRAHLITGRKGCHDYINAVLCNGYCRANTFIVTQWPLLTTVKDFWRMIYDYGIVSTIVISDVSTGIRYPKFWPVKRGKRQLFDVISVGLEQKGKRIWGTEYSYTMRQWEGYVDMKSVLMKAGEGAAAVPKGEGRTATKWISKLFLMNGWRPGEPRADRNESLVEILLEIEAWQKQAGPEKFICIVSTDGVQQAGVFMNLHMAMQQMKVDHKVDIMSSALAIRRTRPQLLPTKEEYEYSWRLAYELQKQMQADAGEFNAASIPEVHTKPIPGLCSRCWFCRNKTKLTAALAHSKLHKSASSRNQLAHGGQPDAIDETEEQETAFLGGGYEDERQPFLVMGPQQVPFSPSQKTSMLTIIPPNMPVASFTLGSNSALPASPTVEATIHLGSSSTPRSGLLQPAPSTTSYGNVFVQGPSTSSSQHRQSSADSPSKPKPPMLVKASKQPAFSMRSEDDNVFSL